MISEERSQKIESYGSAHRMLVAALKRFPQDMWQFRPAPDRWTIHEIVIHIADSEANSYIRCRRLIAEPGSTVLGYDEMKWARDLDYHSQSIDDALKLFKWLRHKSYTLIQDLPKSVWAHTVTHTQDGLIQMDDWLHTYERHIPEHIVQMQANLDDWLKQNKSK
jgi:DinB family protein